MPILVVAIVTALVGVSASVQIHRIGHSGAKATWSDVKIQPGGEGAGDDGD